MLNKRLLTAIISIPIVLLIIWVVPPLYFGILMAIVVAIAAWEWSRLVGYSTRFPRILYVVAVLLGLIVVNWLPALPLLAVATLILIWSLVAIIRFQLVNQAFALQYPEIKIMIGMFMLIPFWIGLLILKINSPILLFLVVLTVWAADSGGYFCGRHFGKHKLISKVSPNKTWEGFFGGMLFALIAAIIVSLFIPLSFERRLIIWSLALLAAIFSVIGDLQISLLKRLLGIKDTGQIFPGHGGMLDRIDSLIAAVIVFSFGLFLLLGVQQ